MELIVRTAHGTADVSIDVHDRDVSLRDLISAVTGQATPTTAEVDGRLVDAGNTLAMCGVVAGSVIDTQLGGAKRPGEPPVVVLRQLTGPGAGRNVPLGVGRYRIGPGRRQHATELSADTTDTTAFDLDVASSGVLLTAGPKSTPVTTPLLLGGQAIDEPTNWSDESITVAGRMFRLEPPPTADRSEPPAGPIMHNRPPGIVEHERSVADAIDEALARSPRLWHRRPDDRQLQVDIGLVPHHDPQGGADFEPVSVRIGSDDMLAITGQADDRAGLARSLIIDLATHYGPADVDIVVATSTTDLGHWDWAKWLPHIRWGSAIDLLTNDLELARLAERSLRRPTVVIIGADSMWNGPDSPLRSFVLDAPHHAAVVVLTDDRNSAPTPTRSIVELEPTRPGVATLTRLDRDGAALELFVPMVDIDTAGEAARRLAPLVDPDRLTTSDEEPLLVALDDVVRPADAATKWDTAVGAPGTLAAMSVGQVAGVNVGADLGLDGSAIVSGSGIREAVDVATVLALSVAATWSPTEASFLLVDHRSSRSASALQELPHHAGTFSAREAAAAARLIARLRSEFTGDTPSASRLVIVVTGAAETELAAPGLMDGLIELAADAVGVHLIVATARPLAAIDPALRAIASTEIAVDRYGGMLRATLHDQRRRLQTPFAPYDDSTTATEAITVRPFVFGRSPSALERRLERGTHTGPSGRESAVTRVARQLAALATEQRLAPQRPLMPVPLPTRLLASDLWSAHHGDGVPLGLIDDPDAGSPVAYWWQPGPDASRVFVGAPRSGVRSALEVLLVGVADRFATSDVQMYVIEHNDLRRAAIDDVPHVAGTASPAHAGAVETLLGTVAEEMHRRTGAAAFRVHDHPTLLVLARDTDRLTAPAAAALLHLLAEGTAVGIHVVATTHRTDSAQALATACPNIIVGSLTDPAHYAMLGVQRSPSVERHVGRVQLHDATMIQLAELDAPLDTVLSALATLTEVER